MECSRAPSVNAPVTHLHVRTHKSKTCMKAMDRSHTPIAPPKHFACRFGNSCRACPGFTAGLPTNGAIASRARRLLRAVARVPRVTPSTRRRPNSPIRCLPDVRLHAPPSAETRCCHRHASPSSGRGYSRNRGRRCCLTRTIHSSGHPRIASSNSARYASLVLTGEHHGGRPC
jgi:hypothetical protein